MKYLQAILGVMLVSLCAVNAFAQAASGTWPLTSITTITSTSTGNVTSHDESFGNMNINSYTGPNSSQRVTLTGGSWPAETVQDDTRFIQFSVTPNTGYDFTVSSVALSLGASGGSNMKANIWYSTDPTFAVRTQLNGTALALPNGSLSSLSYTPSAPVHDGQTFYVRIYPWYTSASSGKYVCPQNLVISGNTTGASAFITLSDTLLPSFGAVLSGTTSLSQSYTVSGLNLTTDIVITAPAGFEVSTDNATFSGSLNLTPGGGVVPATTIYAHFVPSSPNGTVSGFITHASTAATTVTVAVNGIAIASEPSTSSTVTFGTVTGNSIVVNFTGGNGSNHVVVARAGSPVIWTPTDGITVTGVNSDFSVATDQGSGNKVVYDGTGSSVPVTGLTQATTYYIAVYEYFVGTNNSQNYLTSSSGTGNQATNAVPTIVVTPSSLAFGNVDVNTISVEKTYTVSGSTLSPASDNITVNAPAGFEVSTTTAAGFGTSVSLPYTGGALAATTIYVRFHPGSIAQFIGNITNAGGTAPTQNVAVSGNGRGPSEPNVLQAEDGILTSAYVKADYTGYTGSGYVDIADKTGAALEVDFRRATSATDSVKITFANGGSSRAYALSLNGASIGSLTFPGTGSWSTWSSVVMMVNLQAGVNRLQFASTTNSGNANIDKIYIGGQTATPVYKLNLAKSGLGTVGATSASADSFYDAGTAVQLSATPAGGSTFYRWSGNDQSSSNPYTITMNSHQTEIGVMPPAPGFTTFPYEAGPKGFASVGAFTYPNGTTGGTGPGAQVVYVTNSDDLANLMKARVDPSHALNFPPLTVYVIGTLTTGSVVTSGNMCDVKDVYDISIIGVGVDAKLSGFGLNVVRSKNIIVRNLMIENSGIDGITVQANDVDGTGNHLWFDHLTITNCYDGALDITHTASYATVSWNHFFKHDKLCLMGHSDSQTSDVTMKVTYHHNYFDSTTQRHPRVRYGKAHVYNNYYRKNVIYGVSSNDGAQVLMEGSYFLNVPLPSDTSRDGSVPGYLVSRYNIFDNCGAPPQTRGTVFDPTTYYNYSLDSASVIPSLVTAYSGSGKWDFSSNEIPPPPPLPIQLSSFTGHAMNGSVQLLWTTISEINNYGFFVEKKRTTEAGWSEIPNSFVHGHGTTNVPQHYEFTDHSALSGTWQYRLKQMDLDGSSHYTDPVQVDVATGVREAVPATFALFQNYPNPFNPTTEIRFTVARTAHASLEVFNVIGQKVMTLYNDIAESGKLYTLKLNGENLSSGIYFYRLKSGSSTDLKKLMLLK